ncbi:MAG: lysophospholipid acyltransferase family protein [Deltaproteobacteria bacterium]|nr:lysophospholipid acyltransferase family protein [Deltaproteobacteria bacterium]
MARPISANKLQRVLGSSFLKLTGWEVEGEIPNLPKYVMILAPHTSSWDLIFILAVLCAMGLKIYWFGKKEIFHWPLGCFFKWLGGIPVDRSSRHNLVQQITTIIQSQDQIIIGVSPEGTRSNSQYWKTGFYYIAHQAQIPIVFAYLDYGRKVGGLGSTMNSTGDIEEDMKTIRRFYSGITAKYPHEVGRIAIKPRVEDKLPS